MNTPFLTKEERDRIRKYCVMMMSRYSLRMAKYPKSSMYKVWLDKHNMFATMLDNLYHPEHELTTEITE